MSDSDGPRKDLETGQHPGNWLPDFTTSPSCPTPVASLTANKSAADAYLDAPTTAADSTRDTADVSRPQDAFEALMEILVHARTQLKNLFGNDTQWARVEMLTNNLLQAATAGSVTTVLEDHEDEKFAKQIREGDKEAEIIGHQNSDRLSIFGHGHGDGNYGSDSEENGEDKKLPKGIRNVDNEDKDSQVKTGKIANWVDELDSDGDSDYM